MNEDTNYLLPGLDDNDEDGPGISYVHPPRIRQLNRNEWFDNGHEVIPFPSYTTHYLETRHTLHSTHCRCKKASHAEWLLPWWYSMKPIDVAVPTVILWSWEGTPCS